MKQITTLAIDLAKTVFQLHGIDEQGGVVLRRQVRRGQLLGVIGQLSPRLVAMEACASAHYWGRQFQQLGLQVKLIPPQYVKPYVKGNKNDRNDAAAICEAALRPDMAQVAVKSVEQQAVLALHRVRQLLEKQRKQLANQMRGLLAEFGIVVERAGVAGLRSRLAEVSESLPGMLRVVIEQSRERLVQFERECAEHTRQIEQHARGNSLCRRLMREAGIGPIIASAYVATVGDPRHYRNGRQLSASLGLVPRQNGTGGKVVLLGISKRGDKYLRTLLIHGARALLRYAPGKTDPLSVWLKELARRRGANRAAVALANKNARRLWAIWRHEGMDLAVAQ